MLTTESLNNEKVDIRLYSPQALAFLGDAVYEILVRERIVHRANMPVNKLHLQAVEQVRASYQSKAYAVVEPGTHRRRTGSAQTRTKYQLD